MDDVRKLLYTIYLAGFNHGFNEDSIIQKSSTTKNFYKMMNDEPIDNIVYNIKNKVNKLELKYNNVRSEINELLNQRELYIYDTDNEYFNKLEGGNCEVGSLCEIIWRDKKNRDYGYLFDLPSNNPPLDEYDVFVHIPNPDNSDGGDEALPVFKHLSSLLKNNFVEKIIIT